MFQKIQKYKIFDSSIGHIILPIEQRNFMRRATSNFFIALLSKNSVSKKSYVQKELKRALDILDKYPYAEGFFLPVRLDECFPEHEYIKNLHWADMFDDYELTLELIINTIKGTDHQQDFINKSRHFVKSIHLFFERIGFEIKLDKHYGFSELYKDDNMFGIACMWQDILKDFVEKFRTKKLYLIYIEKELLKQNVYDLRKKKNRSCSNPI